MKHNITEIRKALNRRYFNVRRSRAGVWTANDPHAGTVLARRKIVVIGDDAVAAMEAQVFSR